jgi:hypothetical protein
MKRAKLTVQIVSTYQVEIDVDEYWYAHFSEYYLDDRQVDVNWKHAAALKLQYAMPPASIEQSGTLLDKRTEDFSAKFLEWLEEED